MISHRYRCIYVKVPKCASTSVFDWFNAHGSGQYSFRPSWYPGSLSERIEGVTRVLNLYPHYGTFSFVRNPYERFVSIWLHARRLAHARMGRGEGRPRPEDYGTLGDFAELCAELLGDVGRLWGRDARAFFRDNAAREYGPARIRLAHLTFEAAHARPQVDFLPDCNPERLFGLRRVNADPLWFIGTVERIDKDFARLARMLGLPEAALPAHNAAGMTPGRERGTGYAAHYDKGTRRRVEDLYAADLAFTGCGFDDGRTVLAVPVQAPAAVPQPSARRRAARTWLALVRFRLCALEVAFEAWLRRFAAVRRLLRPLKRLRFGRLPWRTDPPPGAAPAAQRRSATERDARA